MPQHDLVVIGGSLGSTEALKRILADLPADLPAAVLVATHLPTTSHGYLPDIVRGACALPVGFAVHGQPVLPARVTFAVPDRHLMLIDHTVALGTGPRENMARPAIDALFRSAALAFGPRVIGVVLSGLLDDGAAGLHAIKARGGLALVQHPLDAEAPDMPRAALEAAEVDHVADQGALGAIIAAATGTEAAEAGPVTDDLRLEVEIALGRRLGSAALRAIAEPAVMTCPQCHGALSAIAAPGPLRFRCQIGHAFGGATLSAAQAEEVRQAVQLAMRLMEERAELVQKMANDARMHGREAVAQLYDKRHQDYADYARTLRNAASLTMQADDA